MPFTFAVIAFLVTSPLRRFLAKRDMRLSNNDDKVLSGMTADQCADSCEKEASFPCRSFDYDKSGKTCYLSSANSEDAAVSPVKDFDFYQMSKSGVIFVSENYPIDPVAGSGIF